MIEVETCASYTDLRLKCLLELVHLVEICVPHEHALSHVPWKFLYLVNFTPNTCSDGTL